MIPTLITHFAAAAPRPCETKIFGLNSWFHYLKVGASPTCDITFNFPGDIPLIMLAIVDDLLRVAAVVSVFYVVYGGIKFITSQGSPDGVASAQRTVLNAVIGLVIALLSVVVVSFLGAQFGGN
jgi:hypothetical protein